MRPIAHTGELSSRYASIRLGRPPDVARPRTVRTLLVGGHAFFRRGLGELLRRAGFHVFGEADSAETAVHRLRSLVPDVVVVDIDVPAGWDVEGVRELTAEQTEARLLVVTSAASEEAMTAAVAAGACGYLLKSASPAELIVGIQAAAGGHALVLPREAAHMLERLAGDGGGENGADLSGRELEVLRLLAQGRDNSEIASALYISPGTAKTHVSHILRKLDTENRIQAAVYAVRQGLV